MSDEVTITELRGELRIANGLKQAAEASLARAYDTIRDRDDHVVRLTVEQARLQARVAWLRRAYGKAWLRRWSMKGIIRDVNAARLATKAERDRLRAVVEAACSELDEIAERSGYGSIGVVVERLIDQLDLSYPAGASEKRTSSGEALTFVGDAASAFIGARDRWQAEAARRGTMPDVEFQRAYDDALDALVHAVRQLDAGREGT